MLFADGEVIAGAGGLTIAVNPALDHRRRAMILIPADGHAQAALAPDVARHAGLEALPGLSIADLRTHLAGSGIVLHAPDIVFYLADDGGTERTDRPPQVRQLSEADHDAFEIFLAQASPADRDDASVDLTHWAVFGSFQDGRLASVASAYPWGNAAIADFGVLTLASQRGKGHGRAVVRAMADHAKQRGLVPQYRCQVTNRASLALANALDMIRFGTWEVAITTDDA